MASNGPSRQIFGQFSAKFGCFGPKIQFRAPNALKSKSRRFWPERFCYFFVVGYHYSLGLGGSGQAIRGSLFSRGRVGVSGGICDIRKSYVQSTKKWPTYTGMHFCFLLFLQLGHCWSGEGSQPHLFLTWFSGFLLSNRTLYSEHVRRWRKTIAGRSTLFIFTSFMRPTKFLCN